MHRSLSVSRSGVTLGRQQKINRLTSRIDGAVQIPILAFNLYVRFLDPIGLVRRLLIRTAALIDFWRIDLKVSTRRPRTSSMTGEK